MRQLPSCNVPMFLREKTDESRLHYQSGILWLGLLIPSRNKVQSRILTGQANVWCDNNCCGSMSFSAAKTYINNLHHAEDGWGYSPTRNLVHYGAYREQTLKPAPFCWDVLKDPDTSCILHGAELFPDYDFTQMSDSAAEAWMRGIIGNNLVGMMQVWNRALARAADKDGGRLSQVVNTLMTLAGGRRIGGMPPVQLMMTSRDRQPNNTPLPTPEEYPVHDRYSGYYTNCRFRERAFTGAEFGNEVRNFNSGNPIQSISLFLEPNRWLSYDESGKGVSETGLAVYDATSDEDAADDWGRAYAYITREGAPYYGYPVPWHFVSY